MSVSSMTGYAVQTRETNAGTLTIEIKSVNSRFLDLQFRIADDLRSVEPALREAIIQRIVRGKVECRVSFGRKSGEAQSFTANEALLSSLAVLQQSIRERFADARPLSVNELLRWPGVLEEANVSQETIQPDLMAAMVDALDAFVVSRVREGAALRAAIELRLAAMDEILQRISPTIPQLVSQFQAKAMQRMQEALGLGPEAGGLGVTREEALDRIRQEVTIYGIRIDIAEELSRLSAHLAETKEILEKGGQTGKRLDFMMQELNREANTIGSKAAIKQLADASMALKLLIEQMREQVQNLE